MLNNDGHLFLQYKYLEEVSGETDYFKLYSNSRSLKLTKEYMKQGIEETPIYIEICDTDTFISNGRGFGFTLEQAEELTAVSKEMIEYLKSE